VAAGATQQAHGNRVKVTGGCWDVAERLVVLVSWSQRWTHVRTRYNCKKREAQNQQTARGGEDAVNAGAGCSSPAGPIDLWRVVHHSLADQGALSFTIGTAAGDVGVPVAWRAWVRQAPSPKCVKWLDVTAGAGGSHQPVTANLASPLSAFAVCHLPSRLTGWNQCDGCRAWLVRPRMQKPPCLCRPLQQQAASLNPVFSAAAGPQAKALPCVAPH
jgi:hypothetical protein